MSCSAVSGNPITVSGIWKRYGVPRPAWLRSGETVWALRDVSFRVARGEVFGIIGRNGAGKSTLLKIIAGVTPATRGDVVATGTVFPMIELSGGVHLDLTGRENAVLMGGFLGYDSRQMQRNLDRILEFAELGDWFDRPLRKYSSGMLSRLGFAVGVALDPDILLVDEVLSVGDFSFRAKCVDALRAAVRRGAAVILVSHNAYLIERTCDRVLWLEEGRARTIGRPSLAIAEYFDGGSAVVLRNTESLVWNLEESQGARDGNGDIRVTQVALESEHGGPVSVVRTNHPLGIRARLRCRRFPDDPPNVTFRIEDARRVVVAVLELNERRRGWRASQDCEIRCLIKDFSLMPGDYALRVRIAAEVPYDVVDDGLPFEVCADSDTILRTGGEGLTSMHHEWEFLRESD
jgi:ABC-type polysaccharide/polyol phosphate transport system ATPase subunit